MIRCGAEAEMPRIEPFEAHFSEYDRWFDDHRFVYLSEVAALRHFIPEGGTGLEIGAGTGRFAVPLNIRIGIDPSPQMRAIARKRGLYVLGGVAEYLPFRDKQFDLALMVTTVCFVDDMKKAFKEVYRILKDDGSLIVGFIDKDSFLGRTYLNKKIKNKFYRYATFYSVAEVVSDLRYAGFCHVVMVQTIFDHLNDITSVQMLREGYGDGGFVAIQASKATALATNR